MSGWHATDEHVENSALILLGCCQPFHSYNGHQVAVANEVDGFMYLMVQGQLTPDHELAPHCIQDDSAHALGLLASVLQVLE
jgi:hypothetical protein